MLRAWRALATFEDRTGLRPWLYRIATNVCIDMLKGRSRRALPMDVAPVATSDARLGDRRPEATWIQPAPDSLILPPDDDPAERAVSRESVRLAFIAALQHLAPRQRAVLILRDVLRWRADRGRRAAGDECRRGQQRAPPGPRRARNIEPRPAPSQPSEADRELLAAYIDAFHRHDVDALVGPVARRRHPRDAAVRALAAWARRHPALADRRRRPQRPSAHARQRQRVAGRRRLPAADAGRPAHGVRHPRPRRRRRAHQRHPLLPRPGAVRTVRPSRPPVPRPAARSRRARWSPRHAPAARAQVHDVAEPDELEQLDQAAVRAVEQEPTPHRDAATCSRASASTAQRSAGTSHETSRSTTPSPVFGGDGAVPFNRAAVSRDVLAFVRLRHRVPVGSSSPHEVTPSSVGTRRAGRAVALPHPARGDPATLLMTSQVNPKGARPSDRCSGWSRSSVSGGSSSPASR